MRPATDSVAPRSAAGRWRYPVAIALLAATGVAVWFAVNQKRGPGLLDGTLSVIVRTTERGADSVPVEEDGALPVQAGGIMSLQVQLKQPAFAYLVWIDSSGQLLPLYPWNTTALEVKDLGDPPPLRRPTKVLNSPLTVGGGWEFGEASGMETVLLLARATPLPEGTSVQALIGSPPSPGPLRLPGELVIMAWDGTNKKASTLASKNRGDETQAKAADDELRALILRLSKHFDLVRVVHFAHAAKTATP